MRLLFIALSAALLSCSKPTEPIDAVRDAAPALPYGIARAVTKEPAWKPAPPSWQPGGIEDQVCRKAISLGCPQSSVCAQMLHAKYKGGGRLTLMRYQTVLQAKNKQEVADSTCLLYTSRCV